MSDLNHQYEVPNKKTKFSCLNVNEFKIDEIINSKPKDKMVVLKGTFPDNSDIGLLILEKSPFPEEVSKIQNALAKDNIEKSTILENDIYSTHNLKGLSSMNSYKLTGIYPATKNHINTFSKPKLHYFTETPLIYKDVTVPYVEKEQLSTKWVKNLIDGTAEQNRIIYKSNKDCPETESYLIALDFKWDEKTVESMHCLAISGNCALRSMRDLGVEHLPLLRSIATGAPAAVAEKYGVPCDQVRLYMHYPPSFYHLHVHISHIHNDEAAGLADRAHPLTTVITNIEMCPTYYQTVPLQVVVAENCPLYRLYNEQSET